MPEKVHVIQPPICGIYRNYNTFTGKLRYIAHDLSYIRLHSSLINRNWEVHMTAKEAIAKRILVLCDERNIAVNALANLSGVAPSTVYSMLNEKSQNPGVVSLKNCVTVSASPCAPSSIVTFSTTWSRRYANAAPPSILAPAPLYCDHHRLSQSSPFWGEPSRSAPVANSPSRKR